MDIRTILANFNVDDFSPSLAQCAADLARRFDANIIGVAAAEPVFLSAGMDGGVAASALYAEQRVEIETKLGEMESQFRATVGPEVKSKWIGVISSPNYAVVKLARGADLIVTGSAPSRKDFPLPALDIGQAVLASGRPVLAVGTDVAKIAADTVIIGWKDGRESRRAVSDAMPFLKRAKRVVVTVVDEGDYSEEKQGLNDLLAWLKTHGIAAHGDVYPNRHGLAATLDEVRRAENADLVVTGGYGHSRVREAIFGGMTRELLVTQTMNRLMSN